MRTRRHTIVLVTLVLSLSEVAQSQHYWLQLEKPTTRNLNRLCFLDSLTGWIVGDSGTILHTTDGAQSWIQQKSGITSDLFDIFMLDQTHGWAVALDLRGPYGTILLKTTDGGAEWLQHQFHEDRYFYSLEFLDSLNGWMGGGSFVGTTDGGQSWFDATIDSSLWANHPVRNIKFLSPRYGYAVGGIQDISAVIWRTTNGGGNWSATEVGAEPLNDLHYFDSLNVLCLGGDFEYGVGIIKSSDGGANWEYVYLGYVGEGRALSFRTPAEAWSAMGYSGTYMYTLDSGRTWTNAYTPDSSRVYDVVFTDTRTGYMVGRNGTVLKYNSAVLDVGESGRGGLPISGQLYQNFPNPFNPSTLIRYDLPEIGIVTMTIYDITGREVRTLDLGIQRSGSHQIPFDGRGLSSGVYFYKLSMHSLLSGKSVSFVTRKMVLIR